MLKQINKSNFLTTPFSAVKEWNFNNTTNDDLLLLETASLTPFLALEYIDYYGDPILNRDCDIALEQQPQNEAIFEEGLKGSGFFYPEKESKNDTGTYKRLVYDQIINAFYNTYKNPLEIFGSENIDFILSRMHRFYADDFRMFSFPTKIYGDSIQKKSVVFYDNSLDDFSEITDDGYGNLVAQKYLFSRVQEVRKFGNVFVEGDAGLDCLTLSTTSTTTTSTTSTSTTSTSTTSTTSTTTPAPTTTTTTTPSTTTTTTSTTPIPPTTSTTTSTSTTSTTSTTPTTTSTTTTSTTPTTTSTSTTPTTTSTTSTTSNTTLPPICDLDCLIFTDGSGFPGPNPLPEYTFDVVHWHPNPEFGPPADDPTLCGCTCDHSTCTYYGACLALTALTAGDPDSFVCVPNKPAPPDCTKPGSTDEVPCEIGNGAGLPDTFSTCYAPVMEWLHEQCAFVFTTDSVSGCVDDPECRPSTKIWRVS